jgi:hypothetical protein
MIDFEPNYIVGCAGTIATFFALLGNFWCKYTSFLFQVTSKLTDATGEYKLYYGVWNYRDTAVSYTELDGSWYITQYVFCRAYGEGIDMDATWKAAMAFTILAVLIGGMASCVSCCANMEVEQCQNINMAMPLAIAFLFATLFQGLSFLFFKSNACDTVPPLTYNATLYTVDFTNDCGLESAAIMSILGCVFWFLTALAAGWAIAAERKIQASNSGDEKSLAVEQAD